MSICLTRAELEELTGKSERAQKQYGAQEKELSHLRIPSLTASSSSLLKRAAPPAVTLVPARRGEERIRCEAERNPMPSGLHGVDCMRGAPKAERCVKRALVEDGRI